MICTDCPLSFWGGYPQLVRRLGQIWSSIQRLRVEYKLLTMNYPATFEFIPGSSDIDSPFTSRVQVSATVMIPALKSKVRVVFTVDEDTLMAWPTSIGDMEVKVELVYGAAE